MMKYIKCFLIHETLWILIFDSTLQLTRKHTQSRCQCAVRVMQMHMNQMQIFVLCKCQPCRVYFSCCHGKTNFSLYPFARVISFHQMCMCVFESTEWVRPALALWEFFAIRICSKVQVKYTFITSFNSFHFPSFSSFSCGFSRFYGSTKSTCTSNTKKNLSE